LEQANATQTASLNRIHATQTANYQIYQQSLAQQLYPTPIPILYRVRSGDNCSNIALAFGLPVNLLVSINRDLAVDCSNLYEGQILLIPALPSTPTVRP
jgi:hypothetical protein